MAESKRAFLDRMEESLEAVAPRLEAAGAAAAEQAAKYRVVMERVHAARRSAALISEDELRAVRLAVERVRADVGRRAV
jgi:hypothetical protein